MTFWGGEPLLERRLMDELIDGGMRAADGMGKRLSLSMPTNGTLIDSETLSWLVRRRIKIFLSIDGDEQSQAERLTKSGASSTPMVEKALELATKLDPKHVPAVRMTVTPKNAHRLPGNVGYFVDRGVSELLIYPAFDAEWSDSAVDTMAQAEQEVAGRIAHWINERRDPRTVVRLKAWMPILRGLFFGRNRRNAQDPLSTCGVGDELIAVNVDGSLSACHRFTFYDRKKGGTLKLGTIEQGVDNEALETFNDLTWSKQRGAVRCTECEIFDLCSMGCVAINYATTGSLTRVPEAACELMRGRVNACLRLNDALAGNPLYPVYLGQSPEEAFSRAARRISRRAFMIYNGDRQYRSQA